MTVRQVAAVRQIHSQDRIAILNRRQINRHVRLSAAVRLHVGMIGAKQFFRAVNCRLLDDISPFAAAVVSFARITLGIFVSKDGTGGFEDGFADKIFAGDQLKPVCLARDFTVDRVGD